MRLFGHRRGEARLLQRRHGRLAGLPDDIGHGDRAGRGEDRHLGAAGHQLARAGTLAQHLALRLGRLALHQDPGESSVLKRGQGGLVIETDDARDLHLVRPARDDDRDDLTGRELGTGRRLRADRPALGHRVRELVPRRHLEAGLFEPCRRIGCAQPGDVGHGDDRGPRADAEGHRRALLRLAAAAVGRDRVLLDDLVSRRPAGHRLDRDIEALAVQDLGGGVDVLPDHVRDGDVRRPRQREGHQRRDARREQGEDDPAPAAPPAVPLPLLLIVVGLLIARHVRLALGTDRGVGGGVLGARRVRGLLGGVQRLQKGVRVLEARVGVLRQRPHHHRVERRRDVRVDRARPPGGFGDLLERHGDGAVALERHAAGERLVEDHADRVDVRARRGRLALRLFRRDVLRRPHHGTGGGDVRALAGAGDAEVGDACSALVVDQDVLGLQVAVHDPLAVREAGRVQDLTGEVDRILRAHPPLDQVLERRAVDVLHRDEVSAVERAAVEDPDDVRVLEAGGSLCLALEALHELGVLREVVVQDLDRDLAVELGVVREPDVGHPARADLAVQAVALVDDGAALRLSHWSSPGGSTRPRP